MGGSDPDDETSKALAGLAILGGSNWSVDVVIGGQNPNDARGRAGLFAAP